ncbi:glycosyltransferase [Sphingomonas sp. 1P08PE]|uniref:glycosyltransferase n=1 Tax=Sphingomonas sp. 1P08PE TaxID=554122 RepID=UPI00399F9A06
MANTLVVVPSVPAAPDGDGFFLDRKAVEGQALFVELWPGPVRFLMRPGDRSAIAFGQHYRRDELPCEIRLIPDDPTDLPGAFDDAAVILAAADSHNDLTIADRATAPVVYIIEYTLATRLRINQLYNGWSLRGLKTGLWTIKTEIARRRAMRRAAGLQCNGTPAFAAFGPLSANPMLYFDTRVTEAQQIDATALQNKKAAIRSGRPLRIAFSGRLDAMKGVDHLIPVAAALAALGVDFHLDIYGDGSLRDRLAEQIAAKGLADRVTMHGPVSFNDDLVPAMIGHTDLFLCCHRQADPSCTYLETLSCGVPIVGYGNDAFRGVARLGEIGTVVAMNDIAGAAAAIAALDADRPRLAAMADAAAKAGRDHSFEREFGARIAHLRAIADAGGRGGA